MNRVQAQQSVLKPLPLSQVDSVLFSEFLSWRVEPSLEPDSPFLQRVYREDIGPCLAFAKREVDSVLFSEFLSWRVEPSLEPDSPFLQRVYREDIGPCLAFAKRELSQSVQAAVESNTLSIEPAAVQALPMVKASAIECGGPKKCALSGMSRACKHRIKLGDSGSHYYISPCSRARITAVCNFFTYIRYIQQGLVRQEDEQMYWEVMRLRKEMSMAKLGFFREDEV
ncbi:UNVERIFIED_CONTAM: hypothetical protein FKN15_034913 [Acipenser sinensis]